MTKVIIKPADGTGAVELFHNADKKIETSSDGATVTGDLFLDNTSNAGRDIHWDASADALKFSDSTGAQFGTGDDLKIYHTGGENFIRGNASASRLYIDSCEEVQIRHLDTDGSNIENMVKAKGDGTVELYYDGSKTFETTSNGHMIKRSSGEPTFRIHCDTDSSPLASIELMRGANDTFGADAYTDWKIADATGGVFTIFQGESGSTTSRITINTSGVLSGDLNDTSDEKKKKNITSIPDGAIAKIKQLRPVNFNWKDPLNTANQSGFIAQEVKTVIPDLVVGEEYDETENNMGYAINTSGVVAHLTKALQELSTEVETLKTKVAALESA